APLQRENLQPQADVVLVALQSVSLADLDEVRLGPLGLEDDPLLLDVAQFALDDLPVSYAGRVDGAFVAWLFVVEHHVAGISELVPVGIFQRVAQRVIGGDDARPNDRPRQPLLRLQVRRAPEDDPRYERQCLGLARGVLDGQPDAVGFLELGDDYLLDGTALRIQKYLQVRVNAVAHADQLDRLARPRAGDRRALPS